MRVDLSSERTFWIAVTIGIVCIMALLFFWVIPTYRSSQMVFQKWQDLVGRKEKPDSDDTLGALKSAAGEIPSKKSIGEWEGYRKYLISQADQVELTFATYTHELEKPFSADTPGEFKEAYERSVKRITGSIKSSGIQLPTSKQEAFPRYPWSSPSNALPQPNEYRQILLDHWSRDYLYRTFKGVGVRKVDKLDIGKVSPIAPRAIGKKDIDRRFQGMRVSMIVVLPPERVADLLGSFLYLSTASSNGSGSPDMRGLPPFLPSRLQISALQQGEEGYSEKRCRVTIDGYIILFPQNLEKKN